MTAIREGRAIDPQQVAALDRNRMAVSTVQPPRSAEGDVAGQYQYGQWVLCPCNGDVTWAVLDSQVYLWFTCGVCGCTFEA